MKSFAVLLLVCLAVQQAQAFAPAALPSFPRRANVQATVRMAEGSGSLTMEPVSAPALEDGEEYLIKTPIKAATPTSRGIDRKSMLQARAQKGAEAAKAANAAMKMDMQSIAERKDKELAERKAQMGTRTVMDRSDMRKEMVASKMESTSAVTAKAEADMAEVMKARAAKKEKFDEYYSELQSNVAEIKSKSGTEIRQTQTLSRTTTLEKQLEAAAQAEPWVSEIFSPANPEKAMKYGYMREGSILASEEALKLPGNKGFDPLGLADADLLKGGRLAEGDDSTLKTMTEAELRHCRAAMLAVVGGPVAPALGLDSTLTMGALIAGFAALELGLKSAQKKGNLVDKENSLPGDYGFDPLGLYGKMLDQQKYGMRYKELNNGRLAMVGIAVYALQQTLPQFAGNTAKGPWGY